MEAGEHKALLDDVSCYPGSHLRELARRSSSRLFRNVIVFVVVFCLFLRVKELGVWIERHCDFLMVVIVLKFLDRPRFKDFIIRDISYDTSLLELYRQWRHWFQWLDSCDRGCPLWCLFIHTLVVVTVSEDSVEEASFFEELFSFLLEQKMSQGHVEVPLPLDDIDDVYFFLEPLSGLRDESEPRTLPADAPLSTKGAKLVHDQMLQIGEPVRCEVFLLAGRLFIGAVL